MVEKKNPCEMMGTELNQLMEKIIEETGLPKEDEKNLKEDLKIMMGVKILKEAGEKFKEEIGTSKHSSRLAKV